MDEDEEYSDTREELLKRFRESLTKPMSERFFDEDDLIEVFDYAGDLNDDYLRMEALLCAARFFPDSEELLERKGIFYAQYSQGAQSQFLRDNPSNGNFIIELLKLRSESLSASEIRQRIEDLVDNKKIFSDEDVIQFVDLCSYLNQYQWLKDNFDDLRKKVQFVNVLIYETAIVAETYKDNDFCIALLEELTQIEPFNSFYWMILSRQYAEMEDWDKSINAIDYSLAINPNAWQSLLVKAKLQYALERPIDDVVNTMLQAIDKSDGDIECVKYLASVYNNEGLHDKAKELLEKAIETPSHEKDMEVIPELILYRPDNIDALLDRFFLATEENSQLMWASWAQQLSLQGFPDIAKKVINCFERHSGVKIPSLFAIEDSFMSQKFEDTIQQIHEYIKGVSASESDFPAIVTMHLVSMIKSGEYEKAYSFCIFLEKNLNIFRYKSVSNRLEYLGLVSIIEKVKNKIKSSTNAEDWADFDPLLYWQQKNN